MPAPFVTFIVPAAGSLTIPGKIWGFTCTQAGPAALWGDTGTATNPLDATTYPCAENQPFASLSITSDPNWPTRVLVAHSEYGLDNLPPPTGSSVTTALNNANGGLGSPGNPLIVNVNNIGTGPVRTTHLSSTNVKTTSQTTAGAIDISGALTGGTGFCSGIDITNTSVATNSFSVTVAGAVVAIVPQNGTFHLDVDPNSVAPITITALVGTVTVGAIAYYHA